MEFRTEIRLREINKNAMGQQLCLYIVNTLLLLRYNIIFFIRIYYSRVWSFGCFFFKCCELKLLCISYCNLYLGVLVSYKDLYIKS